MVDRHGERIKASITTCLNRLLPQTNVTTIDTLQGANESIRNVYQNVADKYQDVLTLEASIAELHQLFLDFAFLVNEQGGCAHARVNAYVHL